ncbi:MAG: PQQ-binding-like beta-propeller repeat protein [Gemmatimonadetes bacterium]|nr:PQQ-binding-like beta-propeller repeat protein [Gemmatimonadota bacterium]
MRLVVAALSLLLLIPSSAAAQQAPGGEAVYKQHCASCHEAEMPRMPSREALRGFSPEAIDTALASFTMRRQGAALGPAERRAVAEFLSGRPAGSYRAPLDAIARSAFCGAGAGGRRPLSGAAWNGWGIDQQNTRFQPADAAGLAASDVPRLRLKWAFGLPGVSASGSQVTMLGSRIFVGSRNGMVYALDAPTGCVAWAFEADAGVRSTPVAGPIASGVDGTLYFGDAHAQVYALEIATGMLRWKVKVEDHPDGMITGGLAIHEGRLYVPVSSLEEGTAVIPSYQCCTFRGSVVSLDAATGRQIWKTHTIATAAQRTSTNRLGTQLWGPSGAAVWSRPTLDPDRNRLYVTTGDSYSNPPAPESDAVMALAMDTGRRLWTRQTLPGDAWNVGCLETEGRGTANCPESAGPDYDFGSSPVLATLPGGQRVLMAGQKSGMLYGLNPDNGDLLWQLQAGGGGVLGGIEWGFAVAGGVAYVSLSGAFEQPSGQAGGMVAVGVADGKPRWTAPPPADTCRGRAGCNTAQPAAVSAIPGVVFSGSLDGHLRAYESETGRVIWDLDTAQAFDTVNGVAARGGSLNGPGATVAGGLLFVSSGYSSIGFMPGNLLLAFSVDGR